MNTFITIFAVVAYFAASVSAHAHGDSSAAYQEKFAQKFGHSKVVKWTLASSLNDQQRAEICSSIHELTGHGPAKMKETKIQDGYVKFDNKTYKPIYTQVLMCKQDNKKQHTYYVTQGIDQGTVTLIHPTMKQMKQRDVFHFTWTLDQVRNVPTLVKLNA